MLTLADSHSAVSGRSLRALSKEICNDNTFLTRMRDGNNFTARSYDRAIQWFSDHWPDGAVWPPEVPRPEAERDGAPRGPSTERAA